MLKLDMPKAVFCGLALIAAAICFGPGSSPTNAAATATGPHAEYRRMATTIAHNKKEIKKAKKEIKKTALRVRKIELYLKRQNRKRNSQRQR